MTDTTAGVGGVRAPRPAAFAFSRGDAGRTGIALLLVLGLIAGAYWLHSAAGFGAKASLSLILGAALGITFVRGRFCFFCILRDWLEKGDSTGMYAILSALAVGGIGYALVFGAFLGNPAGGRLPPDAHIGPVSIVVVAAGVAFGLGMALSGACISGHLYRLGEGYSRAPIALVGAAVGFGLGFFTWRTVYLSTLSNAPVAWLPATLGYGGSLAVHLAVLAAFAFVLLRGLPKRAASPETGALTARDVFRLIFRQRWNPLVTGAIVGAIGTVAYFRIEPLGVTSQIATWTRTALDSAGLLTDRLNGLDTFAGCAAVVAQAVTENGWLIGGLVIGSLAVSLVAGNFRVSPLTVRSSITALGGGVLMGWGSMLALGCTVGTLLSGISAFAISGWVFGAAVIAGVWLGLRLKLHTL
jgi:uncharacterized membrane protein YedE/YeeE